MKNCTLELIVNILTYAVKNKNRGFSQKDFQNIVYTKEFDSYDLSNKIANAFLYLIKRGLLKYKNRTVYYEEYILPEIIKINIEDDTKAVKELSKKIILMYEGVKGFYKNNETNNYYGDIIECVEILNSKFLAPEDEEIVKTALSKILISFKEHISNSSYLLLTIIQLLELKSKIKIKIRSLNYEFNADNVTFKFIEFNDKNIRLTFDRCCFRIEDISNIIDIDTIDKEPLENYIKKSLGVLAKYSSKDIKKIVSYLNNYKKGE